MTALAELAVAQAVSDEYDYETFNGRKEVKMAGGMHGRTIMRLGWRLARHVELNNLGDIYSPDTTFMIGTDERLPDLAFLSRERIPAAEVCLTANGRLLPTSPLKSFHLTTFGKR